MKWTLISLGAGLAGATIAYVGIIIFYPTMYVERAGNIIVDVFLGVAIATALLLKLLKRNQ